MNGAGDNAGSDSEPEREPLLPQHAARNAVAEPRSQTHVLLKDKLMLRMRKAPLFGVTWLAALRVQYGENLLLLLFASQHILKGIVQQLQASSIMWIFRDYHVSGPRMQVYTSISNSAWALKPIIGILSDLVPIRGLHKAPYVIMTSIIGVICTAIVGSSTKDSLSVFAIVLCLLGMSLQASTCDLLTGAKYSEHLAKKPAFGPDLLTYVWGGISMGNIVAISMVGMLIQNFGPRAVFLACVAPASAVLYPTMMNFFEERPATAAEKARMWRNFAEQKEVIGLGILMTACTVVITIVGAVSKSHLVQFVTAIGVLVILLPSFHFVLRPEIAKVNTFFVLQAAMGIGINGASFYFYTDKPEQYPDGPHFSAWFFTTTLGLVSAFMSLLGLATYNRYMKDWTYQNLILICNVMVTLLSLLDVVMYLRLNLVLGIPDVAFVLGSATATIVIRQWQWMPGIVILSQLCPKGMEATMFALLAGCANIGNTISDYIGAFVLEILGVHPTGAVNESAQFQNLWKASCIATMLPAVTIVLIPMLIPRAKQTDSLLLSNPGSAIAGSPMSRWLAQNAGSQANSASETFNGVGAQDP
jgi:folate/biopterin transporter